MRLRTQHQRSTGSASNAADVWDASADFNLWAKMEQRTKQVRSWDDRMIVRRLKALNPAWVRVGACQGRRISSRTIRAAVAECGFDIIRVWEFSRSIKSWKA